MLRARAKLLQSLLQAFDILVSLLIFRLAIASPTLRTDVSGSDADLLALLVPGLVACTAWPLLLEHLELYDSQRRRTLLQMVVRLLVAGCISTALIALATNLVQPPVMTFFALTVGGLQWLVLTAIRLCAHTLMRVARRKGRNYRNVMIVGTGPRARQALGVIRRHPEWGLRIIGFLDEVNLKMLVCSVLEDGRTPQNTDRNSHIPENLISIGYA